MFKRLILTLTGKSSRTEPPAPPRRLFQPQKPSRPRHRRGLTQRVGICAAHAVQNKP